MMEDYPAGITFSFAAIAAICWYFGSYNASIVFGALALLMLVMLVVVKRDL